MQQVCLYCLLALRCTSMYIFIIWRSTICLDGIAIICQQSVYSSVHLFDDRLKDAILQLDSHYKGWRWHKTCIRKCIHMYTSMSVNIFFFLDLLRKPDTTIAHPWFPLLQNFRPRKRKSTSTADDPQYLRGSYCRTIRHWEEPLSNSIQHVVEMPNVNKTKYLIFRIHFSCNYELVTVTFMKIFQIHISLI